MKMRSWICHFVFAAVIAFVSYEAQADVRLPSIFGSNMVLQADMPIKIWGWADPGEQVTVTVGQKRATAKAACCGKWMVTIEPLKAGGPIEVIVEGKNKIKFTNVLIGEVWICSGQSNMAWPVTRALNPEKEIASANFPKIRLFTVTRAVALEPQSDCQGKWVVCSPETVPSFSAVAYFFGRKLHQELGVPVGLIHTSWGGTPAEAWTSREKLESIPQLLPILERWDTLLKTYPKQLANYRIRLADWQKAAAEAKKAGKKPPAKPRPPHDPAKHPHLAAGLFNAMIAPLIPYTIRGAIWYQGESNVARAYQYRTLFPAMIEDWRERWGQGDFPFIYVQLAPFRYGRFDPAACAELREAQLLTLKLPNTGMAVTMDIGNPKDIHPKNKQDVGKRLALWALALAYGKDVVYSGPLYDSMKIESDKIRITFKHVDGGLVAKGGELTYFEIAGPDRKFVPAKAVIDGDTIVVSSPQVKQPVAVRYAWRDDAEPNLFNKAGLPASPFRTDNWPGVTQGNE